MPVLLTPKYRVCSAIQDTDADDAQEALATQRRRTGVAKSWKAFKMGASSCFSFVEAAGLLLYAPKIIADSFGWSRPVAAPDDLHLDQATEHRVGPSLDTPSHGACGHGHAHDHGPQSFGIPEADRVPLAEGILKAMSMTGNFARLVLLVGHGSTVVNNPHATGLDCGACGGMTGEASARIAAALLNDADVRRGLAARGLAIPADAWFVGALHDTCVDEVRLFDTQRLPAGYAEELAELRSWLKQAGEVTRLQRAARLGLEQQSLRAVTADVRRRSRDWAQVRPEWALAGCAAFIAAPARAHPRAGPGRAYLPARLQLGPGRGLRRAGADHDRTNGGGRLDQPAILRFHHRQPSFGSGNKVLHNVVGGAIGVLEGNAGDLRVGLPMQSLHDGKQWMHEPMRLSVFLQAPQEAMDDIIARHSWSVRCSTTAGCICSAWTSRGVYRRVPDKGWQPTSPEVSPRRPERGPRKERRQGFRPDVMVSGQDGLTSGRSNP